MTNRRRPGCRKGPAMCSAEGRACRSRLQRRSQQFVRVDVAVEGIILNPGVPGSGAPPDDAFTLRCVDGVQEQSRRSKHRSRATAKPPPTLGTSRLRHL